MKALPIIWKNPEKYKFHLVLIGPFHSCMNYLGMITGHTCRGSGYAEILLEAGLVTGGCLTSVLCGKSYAKALFCLKAVCEALERMLINVFVNETNPKLDGQAIVALIHNCNCEKLHASRHHSSTALLVKNYQDFKEKVRNGYLDKTAVFWLSVMDHFELVILMTYAVKTNDFELYHFCNGAMANLFFAFDGPNYSK